MKRAPGLFELSRRGFCRAVGGAGVAAIAGCTDGAIDPVRTGRLVGGGPHPDAPGPNDGPTTRDAMNAACTTTPTDVGPAAGFQLDKPVFFSNGNFFVVKDSGGFYALTAVCTHAGAILCVGTATQCSSSGGELYCPRHGATFDFNGNATGAPAFVPLAHYAMCDMSNGHLGVVTSMQVSQSTRLAG